MTITVTVYFKDNSDPETFENVTYYMDLSFTYDYINIRARTPVAEVVTQYPKDIIKKIVAKDSSAFEKLNASERLAVANKMQLKNSR